VTGDDQTEAYFLSAVRLEMIADNNERAAELLSGVEFGVHAREAAILRVLVQPRVIGQKTYQTLSRFFDRIRKPGYRPKYFAETETLRLEIAIIRPRLSPHPNPVTWQEAIDAISR